MATPAAVSELSCSICLEAFDCPSTLSCGHSFCLRCLEAAWKTASSFSCPQCRATFSVRPQLRRNVALANLAEQLRDGMAAAVVCDHCSGGQIPAVKTCLRCEMSFCARHLMPHIENPRLSDHVLVAPIANLEERRCREHREELKYFCEQDEIPVCTGCTITGDHFGHRVITVEKAQQTRQEELRVKKKGREEKRNTAASQTRTLRDDYRRVEENVRGISREFERRWNEEREVLNRVDEEGRSVLSRIQADIARYESRARGLEQEINQLLAALAVKDPLSFLQDPVHDILRLCVTRAECRSSDSQGIQDPPPPTFSHQELTEVISLGRVNTMRVALVYGCSPTLDTNSAHDRLQISSDLRTVTRSRVPQGRSHNPLRFDVWPQALCSESFSSGQHYWEVDVGSAEWCGVGVVYRTIPWRGRGDKCLLGVSNVSWCLQKYDDSFSVLHGGVETSLSVPEPLRRVGVHLDWDEGLLSFYCADSMATLHSFHQTFIQPLHPGLWVLGDVGDSVRIVDLSGAS